MYIEKIYLDGYLDFLKKLKKYNYIDNNYGFNISILKIKDNLFIFVLRMMGTIRAFFNDEVIPGNFSNYDNHKNINWIYKTGIENKIKSIGKNFIWNNWYKNIIDNSIFFVGNIDLNGKIQVFENYGYQIIFNEQLSLSKNLNTTIGDIRLFKHNNKFYYYDSYISRLVEIYFINNKLNIKFNDKYYSNFNICKSGDYINLYDKNWSFYSKSKKYFKFLYWYMDDGVYIIKVPIDKNINNNSCINKILFKYKGDVLPRYGNDNFPMISFSSPLIKINKNIKIGCGYTKFILSHPTYNQKIKKFINSIQDILVSSNSKYIEHFSYIYVPYLFKLVDNKKLFISNPFYVINNSMKYNFSIIYPMSLIKINDYILISAGEGDFYTICLKLKLKNFIDYCIHDVENLKLDDINFEIIND